MELGPGESWSSQGMIISSNANVLMTTANIRRHQEGIMRRLPWRQVSAEAHELKFLLLDLVLEMKGHMCDLSSPTLFD